MTKNQDKILKNLPSKELRTSDTLLDFYATTPAKVLKTYKYKLYNSAKNKNLINQIEIACSIYNHCIAIHKCYYKLFKKSLNGYQLAIHITKLKKRKEYSFWNNLNSQAIQDVVERIDKSYHLFFKEYKKGVRPPSFKKRKKYKSFTLKQTGYKLLDNSILINKKKYKICKDRPLPEDSKIKTITVKRDNLGDLYIYIVVETSANSKFKTGKSAGFDFGLKTFLTSSNEEFIESPQPLFKSLKRLKKLNKIFSKKKLRSNNRRYVKKQLSKLHKKIAAQRKDFHFKLARQLAIEYDNLFFEDLNIKAMQMLWGRKINDLGFSNFISILEYYCKQFGKQIQFVDRFEPTTKRCSNCGNIKAEIKLSERTYICEKCNMEMDRDLNASINILKVGASTYGVVPVRLLEGSRE